MDDESDLLDRLQRRVVLLETALKEKDRELERFLRERDQEIARQKAESCENCENLKARWKRIHSNFQEVPRLLEAMIERTDRLFEAELL